MIIKFLRLFTLTLIIHLSTGYGFDFKSCINHIPNFISMANKNAICTKLIDVQNKLGKHSAKYQHVPQKVVDKINKRISDTANRQ